MSEMPPPSYTPPPGGGSYTPPPPPPPTGGPSTPPGSDRTLMIALSYLWILCLIPLLTKKDDAEVQWHAKNGTALFLAEIVVWIVLTILRFVLPSGFGLGCGIGAISCVIWIGFLVVRILALVKGINGQRYRIPVITDFGEKLNF